MRCPKCKNEIDDNSLQCSNCGAKIRTICKKCGGYNLITAQICANCGERLLKICGDCGAANLPNAKFCRKCGIEFVDEEADKHKLNNFGYSAKSGTQQNVKEHLIEALQNPDLKIITLSGESGSGKTVVLRSTVSTLRDAKLIWLMGTCTQITQLSPFGYFQDLLLSFFNINNFCPDTLQLKKNSIKFFKQDFPTLTNDEILDLLNLLYPNSYDNYENIYYNKSKTFSIMKKVITTIAERTKIIFVIDKYEYIDGMSFDFLNELIKDEYILSRCKFIIISSVSRPGMGIITSPLLNNDNYVDFTLGRFTSGQTEELLKTYNKSDYNKDFAKLAEKICAGNPSYIEQFVFLKNDIKKNNLKNISYKNIDTVIEYRLNILKKSDWKAYRMLIAMSVLGAKFCPAILESFDNNSQEEYERILDKLVNNAYISQINNIAFEFKTLDIWKKIVTIVKNEPIFEEILNILYEIMCLYKHSTIALIAYILQKLSNNDKSFEIWTILMKHASYIGDIGLYIISQKQALQLIENKNNEFYKKVKKNIYTRVGKLLEPVDPTAAFEYLQNAILMLEDDEEPLHIELLGYIANCSMKMGNYFGAIECIESVQNKLPENMKFEKILLRSRTSNLLLKLGNYGQLINEAEAIIFPELEKVLTKGKDTPQIEIKDLFELWLGVYFDFAEALAFQGDNRAFEIIRLIFDILEKNSATQQKFMSRAHLLLALANTIKGNTKTSACILNDMLKEYPLESMDSFVISRWNLIDILNKFFEADYTVVQKELFDVAAYANNVNDSFTKNILKTLLAKILKENNQSKKALEILEEQVSYFAKEKVATGVLLCWYLIAEIKQITNGTQFALDITTKALDIAQSPNINNYYFIALLNKLIGEIYITKQDFDSAKVYLEKAIFISKQFDLEYILVKTYLQCARLYQELALPKTNSRGVYIKQALKMFKAAKNVPVVQTHPALQRDIKENLNILTSFCKLNGIVLKRDNQSSNSKE